MNKIKYAIAEDYKIFRKGIIAALADTPELQLVLEAENGKALLEGLAKNKPDVILLDIKMPEMDGYITLEKIKEIHPDIIVLAFTASLIDAETEKLLVNMGFSGAIPKPFKPEFFFEKISNALGMPK